MKAVSLDVLRALERRGPLETDELAKMIGATRDELREALFELRHLDRVEVDSDDSLSRVVVSLVAEGARS